jgi:hypothetical protein
VVLIAEVRPPGFWQYMLFSQRGAIADRVIGGTSSVVRRWLRYRIGRFARRDAAAAAPR